MQQSPSDGKAFHQYHGPSFTAVRLGRGISDWFGSHGCVRLSEDDAKSLFNWADVGSTLVQVS
ncbi:L,D-transpeptidase family protein [Chitinilyticum litopenaei]|uniref:L,D-transpeptidase family protein n=1 Tax=Chitinilyticum litopenaei TaxID=1121276 RepID=UPI0009DBC6CE